MGSEATGAVAHPSHEVQVDAFWIDEHELTNRQFADFVAETRYITTAEQIGAGHVFDRDQRRWVAVAGADWRHPQGPDSTITGRGAYPVVQVSWLDAAAYCAMVRQTPADGGGVGVCRSRRSGRRHLSLGYRGEAPRASSGQLLAGAFPLPEFGRGRVRLPRAGGQLSGEWFRVVRHGGQRVGLVRRLVCARHVRCGEAAQSAGPGGRHRTGASGWFVVICVAHGSRHRRLRSWPRTAPVQRRPDRDSLRGRGPSG